jgi:hypothetical protein
MFELEYYSIVALNSTISVYQKMSASTSQAVFKFGDGTTLSIDPNLAKLSSFFDEKQKAGVNKFELSEAFIGEAFNTFCEKFFAKYAAQLKKLEDAADKEDWWMEFIVSWKQT